MNRSAITDLMGLLPKVENSILSKNFEPNSFMRYELLKATKLKPSKNIIIKKKNEIDS